MDELEKHVNMLAVSDQQETISSGSTFMLLVCVQQKVLPDPNQYNTVLACESHPRKIKK